MSEEATPVKRRRRSRAVMQAAPLPITATIHLKGKSSPLVIGCFQATQTATGWVFVCPSQTPGMVKTVHVSNADVVELDRWPEAPVFRDAQPVPQEAPQAAAAPAKPKGPVIYANPFRTGDNEGAGLPTQGRPFGSFSTEPFGVPGAAEPPS